MDQRINDGNNRASNVPQDRESWDSGALQAATRALGEPSGHLIESLLAGIGNGGESPFSAVPALSQMLRGLAGLSGIHNPAHECTVGSREMTPFPWSPASSGISGAVLNDPAELNSSLNSVLPKLLRGPGPAEFGAVPEGEASLTQTSQPAGNPIADMAQEIQKILHYGEVRGPKTDLEG